METDDDRLARALEEMELLRVENARLRGLLRLDTRSGDGHRQAWAPTLFAHSEPADSVDSDSPLAARVGMLRSLFVSRDDVYATRWESSTTGKSGWSPAARGGWSPKRATKKEYLPLTDEVLTRHLAGDLAVGVYPLSPGDTCTLLACDFDGGGWVLDALAYLDVCHGAGVPAALERSRSGDGAHVWVFFDGPVPAATARALGASLLREAMTKRAELDLASYDRLFPSQDFMPKGSFGNLIALPLHGERAARGATVFLDPTSLEPWPDQWAFLSSIARLSPDAATALAETRRPIDAGPTLTFGDLSTNGGPPAPEVIGARFGARLSIERVGLPPAVVATLKHLGSIQNPEYFEKQRMRFSTWDTPRFIRCYDEDLEWLHLPRGIAEQVTDLLGDLGSRLDITSTHPEPERLDLRFQATLRPEQQQAVAAATGHDRGVIVAPPGAGKTVMACAVMAHHQTPTLILVDRKPLVEQWQDRLHQHLDLDPASIGVIAGDKKTPTRVVDVAMIQTIARSDNPAKRFEPYGLVVVDECHHLPAVSFEACVRWAPSRRWLGLTATPYRRDGLEGIITLQCGPTRHEITPSQAGDPLMRRELIVHNTRTWVDDDTAANIQAVFGALVDDDHRTDQICADVHATVSAGRTCLVLTQRTAHIDAIVERLTALGDTPLILRGGLANRARQAVADAITAKNNGDGIVLVATGSYLGEGFDWPQLDTLFLAFPIAFKGRVVQYVGRLLRTHTGKHHVELHDYVDTDIPVLERMYSKRQPAYKTLNFAIPTTRHQPPTDPNDAF